jgi:hypothetical protein
VVMMAEVAGTHYDWYRFKITGRGSRDRHGSHGAPRYPWIPFSRCLVRLARGGLGFRLGLALGLSILDSSRFRLSSFSGFGRVYLQLSS